MKITLPAGYELPENARPGEPFEAVATLTQEEDGTFELTAIDGIKLGEEAEPAEAEDEAPATPPMTMPWNQESTLE